MASSESWNTPGWGALNSQRPYKPYYGPAMPSLQQQPQTKSSIVAEYLKERANGATALQAWGNIHTKSLNRKKYWVVWNPQGSVPTVKHATLEAAVKEADRLSTLQKDRTFAVLEAVCEVGYVHTPYANILE